MPAHHTIRVGTLAEPIRLDRFLAAASELALTRTQVEHLIDNGHVRLNGEVKSAKKLLRGGEELTVIIPDATTVHHLIAENISLDVIYEDDSLAVINKPAGLITHPGAGVPSGTLVNALLHRYGTLPELTKEIEIEVDDDVDPATDEASEIPTFSHSITRPGLVHRLDKNTSGLLLVARTEAVLRQLQEQMARREISREYVALVFGHLTDESGTIDAPIGRSPRDRKKMAVVPSGRAAVTHYQLRERFIWADLLSLKLETGRTHQIRVHLAHLKHPIFGDPEYGGRDQRAKGLFATHRAQAMKLLRLLPYQALHAERLSFTHPRDGSRKSFTAPIPHLFAEVLKDIRLTKE